MSLDNILNKILDVAQEVKKKVIEEGTSTLIVASHDADGISSASILSSTFLKNDVTFHIKIVEYLDGEIIENISNTSYDIIFFLDIGSESKKLLIKHIRNKSIIIIDHNQTQELKDYVIELNPYNFGLDGSRDASSSSLTYILSRYIDPTSVEYSPLAIIGSLGDKQDKGEKSSLLLINKIAQDDAIKLGLLKISLGLRLFGLHAKPLVKCLESTVDPILPGLTGNENACQAFLKRIGIPLVASGKPIYYSDLSEDNRRKLAKGLIKYLLSMGYSAKEAESILGYNYYLTREDPSSPLYDAREYATLLNACGKMDKHYIGLALGLGYRDKVLRYAIETLKKYRKIISSSIENVIQNQRHYTKTFRNLVVIDYGSEVPPKIVSSISRIFSTSLPIFRKPYIVISAGETNVRLSVITIIEDTPHLGNVVSKIASSLGGKGGGRKHIAEAVLPRKNFESFLKRLNTTLTNFRSWRLTYD